MVHKLMDAMSSAHKLRGAGLTDLRPDKGHELVCWASTNQKTTVKRWDTNVMAPEK